MNQSYFLSLRQQTNSRFWINNPTINETELALEHGAFACTTNPAFCARLISNETEYINGIIDEEIKKSNNYDYLAEEIYRSTCKRLIDVFLPAFEKSNGKEGYVTMQDDPRYDFDTAHMVKNIQINKQIGPNYMAKIPVIAGGIEAIEECVKMNIPICATEIFACSQADLIVRRYEAACKKYGNRPYIAVTHITGIFDEYLGKLAKRDNIDLPEDIFLQAGIAIARKQYKLLQDMGANVVMLGGGARGMHHFTGIVGGPHVTINWSTAQEIITSGLSVESTVDQMVDESAIRYLSEHFDVFKAAFDDNGLSLEEFADFAPVQLFRNAFLKGWYQLLAQIATRKHLLAI